MSFLKTVAVCAGVYGVYTLGKNVGESKFKTLGDYLEDAATVYSELKAKEQVSAEEKVNG